MSATNETIAAIIPCYKVKAHIGPLLASIGPEVRRIFVVDDCCPEGSGKFVQETVKDPRVKVLFHSQNLGVGGAVKTGFAEAAKEGHSYLVKLDGDGQMDPAAVLRLIRPLQEGLADYAKGNRFFNPRFLKGMPKLRVFGNAALSFMTKLSSGNWNIMDPTNGFVAIHAKVFTMLESEKIENRYFFETDMLYRLHLVGAVVQDVPIPARYQDEKSNLKISRVLVTFPVMHASRLARRIVYDYFVHDFSVGSAQLLFGSAAFLFGMVYGLYHWYQGLVHGVSTETGVIMIATLPTILGFQLLLAALQYDIANRNTTPIHKYL